ncbi:hypothetical protein VTO42DRAFT_4167 [Malbranchea cinnamomea]
MAPSSGHHLLPKVWRVARFAFEKAARAIKAKAPEPTTPNYLRLQPIFARIPSRQHPINRVAAIRQSHSRYFSTARASGRFTTQRAQKSKIASTINRITSRTPFASTLRPNLTGGTLCRTAGGYAIGAGRIGGVRYFSNSPTCPAQVIQNVSAAVRAFWLSGQRVRFDGIDPKTGEKRYKTVTRLQHEAGKKMQEVRRSAPGSYVEFQLSPTITALSCSGAVGQAANVSENESPSLNTPGLLDVLSADFSRALKDFAAVLNDLKRLSALGDLPLSHCGNSILRVHFPGCDADSVERLCAEVGVTRGMVYEDEDFGEKNGTEMALLFPFAPSQEASESELFSIHSAISRDPDAINWRELMLSNEASTRLSPEASGQDFCVVESIDRNPWTRSSSGYSSLDISELGDRKFFPELLPDSANRSAAPDNDVEGIYRFIEELNRAR